MKYFSGAFETKRMIDVFMSLKPLQIGTSPLGSASGFWSVHFPEFISETRSKAGLLRLTYQGCIYRKIIYSTEIRTFFMSVH